MLCLLHLHLHFEKAVHVLWCQSKFLLLQKTTLAWVDTVVHACSPCFDCILSMTPLV